MIIGQDWEEQLAPFQENNMGDCPKDYLTFTDQEDEFRKEYEEGSTKEKYKSFEEFCKDYHGHDGPDDETGRYGYWENENAKWDWYQLGGRWRGYFMVKAKPEFPDDIVFGEPGVPERIMLEEAEGKRPIVLDDTPQPRMADQLRKCDIDIEGMQRKKRQEAEEEWDKAYAIVKDCPKAATWKEMREQCENNTDVARDLYNRQSFVKKMKEANMDPFFDDVVEIYQRTREEFVDRAVRKIITPFAVVMDGKWYESGKMGWWGCVSEEKDEDAWGKEFFEMFSSLPGDTLISVVDAHI